MKFGSLGVLILAYGVNALTSCSPQKGLFTAERYQNQVGQNGVRRMAEPNKNEIDKAMREHGTRDWDFRPEKDGYLYSEPTVIKENKRSIAFQYDGVNMRAVSFDPVAQRNDQSSAMGETKPLTAEECGVSNFSILKASGDKAVADIKARRQSTVSYSSASIAPVAYTPF